MKQNTKGSPVFLLILLYVTQTFFVLEIVGPFKDSCWTTTT